MNTSINLFYIIASTGLVVKLVLITLVLFSITSWSIIFFKLLTLLKAEKETSAFKKIFWNCKNISDAYGNTKVFRESPLARVFQVGYVEVRRIDSFKSSTEKNGMTMNSARSIDNIRRKMKNGIADEMKRLSQMVPFLATAGNTAPFIGLFGTVWGIMDSFHNIGKMKSASLAVVAPGISEALVATAVGLIVAIPSVIAFNYFINKLNRLDSELTAFSTDFLNIVEYEMIKTGK